MTQFKKKSIALILSAFIASLSCFGGTASAAEAAPAEPETAPIAETASAEESSETDSLYAHGLKVVSLLSEMVRTEYPELLSSSDDILSVIQNVVDDDFSAPKAVYSVSMAGDVLSVIEEFNHLENASDALKTCLAQKVFATLITRVNSMGGPEVLAAASICTASSLFVDENADRDIIYLYTYDDAAPIAVIFNVGEDHAVSAEGSFVLCEDFTCGSVEEITEFFSYLPVEVEEVQIPESKN